ncbi:MAG: hypothetical protein LBM08_15145, partial [Dysgonamonadaceae bacterium]|nr:hypothetical protein [Dysgonamonadaceae bacterium]
YNVISFDLRVGNSLVKSIIEDFGLFEFTEDGKHFYSVSFSERMKPFDGMREKRSVSGKVGMTKRWKSDNKVPTVLPQNDNKVPTVLSQNDNKVPILLPQNDNREEEIKEEEIKEEEKEPPTPFETNFNFDFCDEKWQKLILRWIEWCATREKRMNQYQVEAIHRTLEGFGFEEATQIVEASILNGWITLYPDRFAEEKAKQQNKQQNKQQQGKKYENLCK